MHNPFPTHSHDHLHDHAHAEDRVKDAATHTHLQEGNSKHGHNHHHVHGTNTRHLWLALSLTFGFAFVELIAGLFSGSLALLGDAGHMFTDSLSIGLAVIATKLAQKPPSARLTYGLKRAEILAALVNVLFMFIVVFWLSFEAWDRLWNPRAIHGETMSIVAFIGLLVNLFAAWILMKGEQNLNVRGALLHVLGDLLGSVAALFAGIIIIFTGFTPIDPILTLFISALILFSSGRLLKEVVHVLLEGAPENVSTKEIGLSFAAIPHVLSVHDLHIWTLSSRQIALSAHLVLASFNDWLSVLKNAKEIAAQHGIDHITLQPELTPSQVIEFREKEKI